MYIKQLCVFLENRCGIEKDQLKFDNFFAADNSVGSSDPGYDT